MPVSDTQHQAPEASTSHVRAAAAACRDAWPDLAFAASFLPKPRRHAAHCTAVVLQQIVQIIDPAARGDGACEDADDKTGCPTPQACGETCQGGETPQQRLDVCSSVLDYLFTGQPTGRDDLDGFHTVTRQFDLPRDAFVTFAAGLSDLINTPRVATWRRLREGLQTTCGAAARLMWSIASGDAAHNDATKAQVDALGSAAGLIALVGRMPHDWRAQRVLLPLDDLVQVGLSDRDIGRCSDAGSTDGDERWLALVQLETTRARHLLTGAAKSIRVLEQGSAKRAWAAFIAAQLSRIRQMTRPGFDPFAQHVRLRLWDRLMHIPTAFRLATAPADASTTVHEIGSEQTR